MEMYSFSNCNLCKKVINLDLDEFEIYTPFEEERIVTTPHILVCGECHKKLKGCVCKK